MNPEICDFLKNVIIKKKQKHITTPLPHLHSHCLKIVNEEEQVSLMVETNHKRGCIFKSRPISP